MDVKYLEYILEIAEQKSITRAAENLYVTQSSLSQYLLKLEDELGTRLFTRTKNELILTDAGEMYVQAARTVVRIRRTLYDNIAALKNEGCIRLGISSQWGAQMAADLLPSFKKRFPGVRLTIHENRFSRLKRMLASEKLDLAVMAATNLKEMAVPYERLRREELLLAVPADHPFCTLHPAGQAVSREKLASELKMESFIFSDQGSTIRMVEDSLFQELGFRPQIVCELNSNRTTLQMVAKGAGIALVPGSYVRGCPDVRAFPFQPGLYRSNILAYRKNLKISSPEKFLIELIRNASIFSGEANI